MKDDVAVPLFDLDVGGYRNRDKEQPAWIELLLRRLRLERVLNCCQI